MGRVVLVLLYILGFVWCTFGNQTARPEARIIGGEIASPNEFPHHVLVATEVELPQGKKAMICGGSIISSQYVLTAAHCLHKLNTAKTQILVGVHELDVKNDIALIRLSSPVSYDGLTVTQIKRDVKGIAVENGSDVTTIGWGRTSEKAEGGDEFSRVLKKAVLRIVGEDDCRRAYSNLKFLDYKSQVCASNKIDIENVAFACYGDSGGSLICSEDDTKYICGITSFVSALACKKAPSVYTRVSHFKNWIEDVISNGRQSSLDCIGGLRSGAVSARLIMVNLDSYYCFVLILILLKYIL